MRIGCKRDPAAPYIMVWVRLECKALMVRGGTEFAIDTGSPMTLLSYPQAVSLGIPLEKLTKSPDPIRIGGVIADAYLLRNVALQFRTTDRGKIFAHSMERIYVLGPSRTASELPVPGILGTDFLNDFTFIAFSRKLGGGVFITDEDMSGWLVGNP